MVDWITDIISSFGYLGVALLMALEGVFPVLSSEAIVSLAGFSVAQGKLGNFFWVVVAGTIGSVLGIFPWYYVGKRVGKKRLKQWIDRHGKWLTLSNKDIDKSKQWFGKYGGAVVFFGRLIPTIRTYISIPAGLVEMPLLPFFLYSVVGIVLWVGLLAYTGYTLGQNYYLVKKFLSPVALVAIAAIVIAFGSWLMHRKRKQQRNNQR
ncbi:alkaline phosphatase [Scytonema hofmannii PCC 7110]|uniref:Alkaline phosphatase n=1 Tax=Scytonema hofmannii PCC 7110 TaxID=128403 RepID=A0A139XG68_9CYAN|nr:DedA family protein [Scytonema hofmannii]KYC43687.1 alkaline phosphatase [Scytonema hofmannii PCC 7110]